MLACSWLVAAFSSTGGWALSLLPPSALLLLLLPPPSSLWLSVSSKIKGNIAIFFFDEESNCAAGLSTIILRCRRPRFIARCCSRARVANMEEELSTDDSGGGGGGGGVTAVEVEEEVEIVPVYFIVSGTRASSFMSRTF